MKLKRKLFFERTKEMEETAENFKELGRKANRTVNKLKKKLANLDDTAKEIKNSVKNTYKKYKDNPSLIKENVKSAGKKAIKFIKENPRDALYIGASYTVVPWLVGKKFGPAAAATVAALPVGETAIALDHGIRSKTGKTALKAAGQIIKGTASDIKKKFD